MVGVAPRVETIAVEGGEVHVLMHGLAPTVFGLRYEGADKYGAAKLILKARALIKADGYKLWSFIVDANSPLLEHDLSRCGFVPACSTIALIGEIR